ncbi:hypothetical protein Cgig2_034076 [Carnegiea gigantea]|uniref:Uncharacterized protein n=1 Tax=Carnegiea gigantea TaxID=171969 RepID=A0A9Q1JQH5_9CARY|nr:hypothetical protein Cgig2_034076 [Carnegiea gigantea]
MYDWLPKKCTHCGMLGHTEDQCRKKEVVRKEWRKVQKATEAPQHNKRLILSSSYSVNVLKVTEQYIHSQATQISNMLHFHVTIVYGKNQDHQRQGLWEDLQHLSQHINGGWCILGNFSTILYKEDKYGGNDVSETEVQELTHIMEEMNSMGAYYSWTNKTIWSRIDRAFINVYWYETFNYIIAKYLPSGLSDHTPLLIQFLDSPRPRPQVQFYDMWLKHTEFQRIIAVATPPYTPYRIQNLRSFTTQTRPQL